MLRTFVVGLLLTGSASAADETYLLKLYKSKTGDKTEVEKTDETKGDVTIDLGGNVRKQAVVTGKKEVYTEEILAKKAGDRQATKLTRTYRTAEKTEMGKTAKAVYDGETVAIEKKGDTYTFSIDGKPLTEDEAPDLFKSFNKKADEPTNHDFLPEEAVKVGGTWKVPAAKAAKMFASLGEEKMKVDAKKSSISGKLLKVYEKAGARFGVIELTVSVAITEMDLGGQFVPLKDGGKTVVTATIDTCIDGSVPGEVSKIAMTQNLVAELPNNGTLTVVGTTTGSETTKPVKKQ